MPAFKDEPVSLLQFFAKGQSLVIPCLMLAAVGCSADRRAASPSALGSGPPAMMISHRQPGEALPDVAGIEVEVAPPIELVGQTNTERSHQAAGEFVPALPNRPARSLPRDATEDPDSFRDLSESEMLSIALQHSPVLRPLGLRILANPASASTIYDTAISASDPFFGPDAALAEFDAVLSASVNAQNNDRVFNNATLGGDVQQLVQDLVTVDTGWQKRSTSGAIWELNGLRGYDSNNRVGNTFPSYWEAQLEAGVRQPLLRGAGREFNTIAGPNARPGFNFSNGIVIARLNNKISDAEFKIQLRGFVQDLYSAYWDLDRHYRNYTNLVQARELAYRTWQSTLAKMQANLSGGEANKEAQARAKYYSYRREVQVALGGQGGQDGLYVAERRLRNLIGLPIVDGELLRPVDDPLAARVVYDFDLLVSQAMCQRTELARQSLRVRQQQLRLVAAKNFLLPQMDLIGRYRLRGLGDDLTGDGPRFSSAYQDFFSFDHQEWEFGLEMGVVAHRRQARAAVRHATLQVNRERSVLEEQRRAVQLELSDAFAEVASSYASMESSIAQVDAAQERLDASTALFEADKIQIEFLLDAQEELLRAQLQLSTDMARYTVSIVAVNAAVGSLLDDIGIYVQQTGCQSIIHFADPHVESTPVESIPVVAAEN